MTNIYHAAPYDIHAAGFYFSDYAEYRDKAAKHLNEFGDPVEEYEIQFIDGDNAALFKAVGVNQANLKDWFDRYEAMDEDDAIKAIYLADHLGYRLDDMIDKLDDVCLFEGTAIEYAESHIEDTGLLEQMPENLRFYFDTVDFARDMVLGGDIFELDIDGTSYIVWGC